MNNKVNWKTLAIIFFILFVLETCFVAYLFRVGSNSIAKEQECVEICTAQDMTTYYYDEIPQTCYCMLGGEVQRTIDLK